jgi:chemotaxis regulatin CheY-phosphate phosphatase CheZ
MTKRPRPFTAETRSAELSGASRTITNDDLLEAFNDLSNYVKEATHRLETVTAEAATVPPAFQAPPAPSADLEKIKREVAALKAADPDDDEIPLARQELKTVVEATDTAANEIMNLSENIQAAADKIRGDVAKGNTDTVEAHCEVIDEAATNLLMACGFQDLTGQRINKVVNALTHLEGQIDGLFETLGISQGTGEGGLHAFAPDDKRPDTDLLHGPQDEGEGISQAEIDAMFD